MKRPVLITSGWGFECSGPIYCGSDGSESLDLWYAKGQTDLLPEGGAWPWITGQYPRQGVDDFSSEPGMDGLVASGTTTFTSHLSDHDLGGSAPGDVGTWTE